MAYIDRVKRGRKSRSYIKVRVQHIPIVIERLFCCSDKNCIQVIKIKGIEYNLSRIESLCAENPRTKSMAAGTVRDWVMAL